MSEDKFQELVKALRCEYRPEHGSLAHCRRSSNSRRLSLCVSSIRNENSFIPGQCILWDNNHIVYEGKLDGKRLLNKLNKFGVCHVEITTVDDMEQGLKGKCMCLGDQNCCRRKCALKKQTLIVNDFQVPLYKSKHQGLFISAVEEEALEN